MSKPVFFIYQIKKTLDIIVKPFQIFLFRQTGGAQGTQGRKRRQFGGRIHKADGRRRQQLRF